MEIERGILGGVMHHPEMLAEVYDILRPEDFANKKHGIVYQAMIDLAKKNQTPDLLSVGRELINQIDLGWLSEVSDNACFKSQIKREAKNLSDKARGKRLKIKLLEMTKSSLPVDLLIDDLIKVCGESISKDSKGGHIKEVIKRFRKKTASNAKKDYGLNTGYMFLEDKYIRYMPGHVWVIGAYTSVGKTATLVDMLCRLIEDGVYDPRIAVISTEMMEEQNVARFLARQTGYVSNLILSGKINEPRAREEIDICLDWFASKDIFLFDDLYSIQDIEMRLRQISMSKKIDVVFLDYVQNTTFEGADTEYDKTQKVAKALQRIAKQLNCCIVCLSQIPNTAAKDDQGILEYKGGGELAAVADIGVWLKRNKNNKELLAFEIRKNRHGATGKKILQFVNNFKRLKEIPHDEDE